MKKTLVIMAAGMGSRYGGLKQVDPITDKGEIILDFSVYDAIKAGFDKIVFVIKKENEEIFRELVSRYPKNIKYSFCFQDVKDLPQGFCCPDTRVKPWGTGHALLCASSEIEGDFAVINADDFYGRESFMKISEFLSGSEDCCEYAMVGYLLRNTLSENGSVARGVCNAENGFLSAIEEHTDIRRENGKIVFGAGEEISPDTVVSLNFFAFKKSFLEKLQKGFTEFLEENINEEKKEYFLPSVVSKLIGNKTARVKILKCNAKWYGVTYKEDKSGVETAVSDMKKAGLYPASLWE